MECLQKLRDLIKEPLIVTSGYRDATHPIEAAKRKPGEHSKGKATDVKTDGKLAYSILKYAPQCGFTRIGVSKTFMHLGTATEADGFSVNTVWVY
jgi:hypothetical protein